MTENDAWCYFRAETWKPWTGKARRVRHLPEALFDAIQEIIRERDEGES